jgi:ribosome-associated heat shock protein Hsp15
MRVPSPVDAVTRTRRCRHGQLLLQVLLPVDADGDTCRCGCVFPQMRLRIAVDTGACSRRYGHGQMQFRDGFPEDVVDDTGESRHKSRSLMRADKYLHHIRVFKTRGLATQACSKGNVTIRGSVIKPGRDLQIGEVMEIDRGDLHLTIKVTGFPENRVGAPRVAEFCENLTPPEAYAKAAEARKERALVNPTPMENANRPNKQQMRQIREWLGRE